MSVLVIAEHVQGRVRDVTYELISAARSLGATLPSLQACGIGKDIRE